MEVQKNRGPPSIPAGAAKGKRGFAAKGKRVYCGCATANGPGRQVPTTSSSSVAHQTQLLERPGRLAEEVYAAWLQGKKALQVEREQRVRQRGAVSAPWRRRRAATSHVSDQPVLHFRRHRTGSTQLADCRATPPVGTGPKQNSAHSTTACSPPQGAGAKRPHIPAR